MSFMFRNAVAYNQDLSGLDVSNVTNCQNFSLNANLWSQPKPNFTNCTP